MATHNDFGKEAEEFAVTYLKDKGYKILTRNFRFQKAEIDIIAEKDNMIVVIEVKARSTDVFLLPQEAVNKKKIRLIVSAADHYLEEYGRDNEVRFDIVSVLPNGNDTFGITHIENAFEAWDAN
ncbi:YraN family protein [Chryseobacterium sp.]|uniref:YraN family protein n=1 Tax=Chryseobacterium sp. TaxID=1871047 RepID=UPI0025B9ED0D|nr:YraN family protein [Chryseobacterium sp.]